MVHMAIHCFTDSTVSQWEHATRIRRPFLRSNFLFCVATVVTTESNEPCHVYTRAYIQCSRLVLSSLCVPFLFLFFSFSPPLILIFTFVFTYTYYWLSLLYFFASLTLVSACSVLSGQLQFFVLMFVVTAVCTIVCYVVLLLVPVTGSIWSTMYQCKCKSRSSHTHHTMEKSNSVGWFFSVECKSHGTNPLAVEEEEEEIEVQEE